MSDKQTDRAKTAGGKTELWTTAEDRQADRQSKDSEREDRALDYCIIRQADRQSKDSETKSRLGQDKQTDREKTAGGQTQSFGLLQKTDKQTDREKTAGGQTQTELWTTAESDKQTERQSKDNRKTDTELRTTAEDRAKTAGGQTQTELWTTEANVQTTFQS